MMFKINLKFLKKSKPWLKRAKAWAGKRPLWLKFLVSVLLLSTLTSLLAVFLYDRYYGASPISNKGRFVREAVEICNQAQTLSATLVGGDEWPIEKDYDLRGQSLADVLNSLESSQYYASKDGPTPAEAAALTYWLRSKYADYFSAKERCDEMAAEYQQKYSY